VIRNDQVGIHEPNPLTHFPSFQIFPDISPSSSPNLFQCPRFVSPFFLTPCPALPTHCLMMWMIIWRLPLKEQKTHCDRFWCESQLRPTIFTEPFHNGTLWGPRVEPWGTLSLSMTLYLHLTFHGLQVKWMRPNDLYLIIHERNAPIKSYLSLSCYQGNLLTNCCTLVLQSQTCAGVPVFISGNLPPVRLYVPGVKDDE